ncbi:MAG: RNA 2'-phosphotransferase [Armatimonadota bacterium]|nr:RNA 2'-phosphotransferase [Armatimonadota bacterium]MDR7451610.1 RNA 2'-phosphotransferase [Armatimonadota bacterium]MDR7467670.1 RNA 2'-phosphotransferase [Armatimonadota bacterium]MDR7492579.1 RNA 2'-phosphotransferase [Armatimonadota bacterium]MDR7499953.1 RNA 2'-phosphotransferase [Armatimonadota bacterium]
MRSPGRPSSQERDDRLSRFLALILRHKPESVGITLDAAGFVELEMLAAAIAGQPGWAWVTAEAIRRLAGRDVRRYELVEGRIRARYGHTVPIETPGTPVVPPEWLYHGAPAALLDHLRTVGLHPQDRQFVHLSATRQEALVVARRHSADAVVITVLARRAAEAGVTFYQAGPSLYLTRSVPPEFLRLPNPEESA